jgi:hypothetical protein
MQNTGFRWILKMILDGGCTVIPRRMLWGEVIRFVGYRLPLFRCAAKVTASGDVGDCAKRLRFSKRRRSIADFTFVEHAGREPKAFLAKLLVSIKFYMLTVWVL